MILGKNVIAILSLIGINVISYFIVLPIAQNIVDQHYGNGPFVILYIVLAIITPFLVYRIYIDEPSLIFRRLIHAIILSFIFWAIMYFRLECSLCSNVG